MMTTNTRRPLILAALVTSTLLGQEANPQGTGTSAPEAPKKTELPEDVQRVCAQLAKAHGERPCNAFSAAFQLKMIAKDGPAVSVIAETTYLLTKNRRGKAVGLIRTKVRESDNNVERGKDAFGHWVRQNDVTQNVTGNADLAAEEEAIEADVFFAAQTLRFLNPSQAVASLTGHKPVKTIEETVRVPGTWKKETRKRWQVVGITEEFPFYFHQRIARARLTITVDVETGTLASVVAVPLRAGVPAPELAEGRVFWNYEPQEGLLVPRDIVVQGAKPTGDLEARIATSLASVRVDPKLTAADMARPKS